MKKNMPKVSNHPDGSLSTTDYWTNSELNRDGHAWLNASGDTLCLLVPTACTAAWLPEIKTAQRVLVEPPARPGKTGCIDLVFDDGSPSPFSLCLDAYYQVESLPPTATRCLVYVDGRQNSGGSGDARLAVAFPCEVHISLKIEREPPPLSKYRFLDHITVNTGDIRKASPREEVSDEIIGMMRGSLATLREGLPFIIVDGYSCTLGLESSRWVFFDIWRLGEREEATQLVRFTVCKHSNKKSSAWETVNGKGPAPQHVPFCAVYLYQQNFRAEDLPNLPILSDFECCLAWTWLETPLSQHFRQ